MRPLATALAVLLFADPLAHAAHAQPTIPTRSGPTIPVGDCSESAVRSAISGAPNGATVDLTALSGCTITLTAGEIAIGVDNLTVQGPADRSLTLSGNHASRVFHHTGHGRLTLDHLDLTNGRYSRPVQSKYTGYVGTGGAVHSDGSVTLSGSRLTNSSACHGTQPTAGYGGGLFAEGDVSVIRSTVSGNTACGAVEPAVFIINYHGGAGGGILALGNAYVSYSTISGNHAPAKGGGGVFSEGNVTIAHSAVAGNIGLQQGGGVLARGSAVVRASTISGNTAMDGGGLSVKYGGTVEISDSTVAFNTANRDMEIPEGGGGGLLAVGPLQISNTIFVNNTSPDVDFASAWGGTPSPITGDHNIVMSSAFVVPPDTIATDPGLQPLGDNGGPTPTHALAPGSVAIDAGLPFPGLAFDQRGAGFPRVLDAAADIGAFEYTQAGVLDRIFSDGFD